MAFPKQGSMDTPPILNEVEKVYNAIKRHQRMIATGVLVTFLSVAAASSIVSAHGNGSAHPIDVGGNDNGEDNNSVTGPIPHETPQPTIAVLPTFTPIATETPEPTFTPILPQDLGTPNDESTKPETNKTFDWASIINYKLKNWEGDEIILAQFEQLPGNQFMILNNVEEYPVVGEDEVVIIMDKDGTVYFDQDESLNRELCAKGCRLIIAKKKSLGLTFAIESFAALYHGIASGQIKSDVNIRVQYPDKDKIGQVSPDKWVTTEIANPSLSLWEPDFPPPKFFAILGKQNSIVVTSNDNLTLEEWKLLVIKAKKFHNNSDMGLKNGDVWGIHIFESQAEVDALVAYSNAHPPKK